MLLRTPASARSYRASVFLLDWLCYFCHENKLIHSIVWKAGTEVQRVLYPSHQIHAQLQKLCIPVETLRVSRPFRLGLHQLDIYVPADIGRTVQYRIFMDLQYIPVCYLPSALHNDSFSLNTFRWPLKTSVLLRQWSTPYGALVAFLRVCHKWSYLLTWNYASYWRRTCTRAAKN